MYLICEIGQGLSCRKFINTGLQSLIQSPWGRCIFALRNFLFQKGNMVHVPQITQYLQLGLGQHPIIKHIHISALQCMNIHTEWDEQRLEIISLKLVQVWFCCHMSYEKPFRAFCFQSCRWEIVDQYFYTHSNIPVIFGCHSFNFYFSWVIIYCCNQASKL